MILRWGHISGRNSYDYKIGQLHVRANRVNVRVYERSDLLLLAKSYHKVSLRLVAAMLDSKNT